MEIDEQQVNLTRFSLFFPEKRDFFLEGRGIFDFARGGVPARFFGSQAQRRSSRTCSTAAASGSTGTASIPIDGGGRLTGKVGKYGVGIMNIQTGDETVSATEPTNFTVVRVKRDVLRRSSIGAHGHEPLGSRRAARLEPGVRRGRGVLVLPERRHRRVLGAHGRRRGCAATTRAIRAASTTAPIGTARTPST